MGAVIIERQGVDDANAGKGEAGLAGHPWQGVYQAEGFGMTVRKQARHVGHGHRAVPCAACRRVNFDQGFQPDHAAGAVADEADVDANTRRFGHNGRSHIIGTKGAGGGVAGDINLHARHPAISISRWASFTRPLT